MLDLLKKQLQTPSKKVLMQAVYHQSKAKESREEGV